MVKILVNQCGCKKLGVSQSNSLTQSGCVNKKYSFINQHTYKPILIFILLELLHKLYYLTYIKLVYFLNPNYLLWHVNPNHTQYLHDKYCNYNGSKPLGFNYRTIKIGVNFSIPYYISSTFSSHICSLLSLNVCK